MRSSATTVEQYLAELPEGRREAISVVRKMILENLPEGYEEVMNWGMICYQIPLEIYPKTYNDQPLMYAALASQKRHMAVYLSGLYSDEALLNWFVSEYEQTGKKLHMGKSCVRFTALKNLPLELIGKAIAKIPMEDFIDIYEQSRQKK